MREKPRSVTTEGNSEFFRIELELRVIRIARGIVRSRGSVRSGNEDGRNAVENDHRRSGKGVRVVMNHEFPRGFSECRRFRRNRGKHGSDVRGAFCVKCRRPIRRQGDETYRREYRENGDYDDEFGKAEGSEFSSRGRSERSCDACGNRVGNGSSLRCRHGCP